jgi:hypothetical protein
MPASSNHTGVSVHCCHGKHTVASSRTLLSDLICQTDELSQHLLTSVCFTTHWIHCLRFTWRLWSSGIYVHVVWLIGTKILKEPATSIFCRTAWCYIPETIFFVFIFRRTSNLTKYYTAVEVKLSLGLINQTPHHDVWGSEVVAWLFLTSPLSRDQWSFSHPCHLPPGKQPQYALYKRMGAAPESVWCYREEKNILPSLGIEALLLSFPAFSLVAILIELFWLHFYYNT